MTFVDLVTIHVSSGNGGKGHVSFRREKFVPMGGPDGGNGGNGGDVVFIANRQLGTLLDFTYKRKYKAEDGAEGGKNRRTGKSGADVIIQVPCGTVIRDKQTQEQLADLDVDGQTIVLAKGGYGGRGNSEFATAVNQAPRHAEPGTPGQEFTLELELKLLADVGLVGFPNVGKSTLISAVSAAKPKIADYHFTTLVPNLGIVRLGEGRSFTMADIPGLIEGASEGRGLGHQFLRHIERTAVLVYVIDAASEHPEQDLVTLKTELHKYDTTLSSKPSIVVCSRIDMLTEEEQQALEHSAIVQSMGGRLISAVTGQGIRELLEVLWQPIHQQRAQTEQT
ncbi:MAG: GTPase ObgE [Bradyrhizobiaceae bacterium]|nr:GTPase ObgE [Bradyrhizobiaceae bacterium]